MGKVGVGEGIIPSSLLKVEDLVHLWGRLLLCFGKINTNLKLYGHCQPECRCFLFWFSIVNSHAFGDRDCLFVPFFNLRFERGIVEERSMDWSLWMRLFSVEVCRVAYKRLQSSWGGWRGPGTIAWGPRWHILAESWGGHFVRLCTEHSIPPELWAYGRQQPWMLGTPQKASPVEAPVNPTWWLVWVDGFMTSFEMPHWELPEICEGNISWSGVQCRCNA